MSDGNGSDGVTNVTPIIPGLQAAPMGPESTVTVRWDDWHRQREETDALREMFAEKKAKTLRLEEQVKALEEVVENLRGENRDLRGQKMGLEDRVAGLEDRRAVLEAGRGLLEEQLKREHEKRTKAEDELGAEEGRAERLQRELEEARRWPELKLNEQGEVRWRWGGTRYGANPENNGDVEGLKPEEMDVWLRFSPKKGTAKARFIRRLERLEKKAYGVVHNLIAHPLSVFLPKSAGDAVHDFTAERAWPGQKDGEKK